MEQTMTSELEQITATAPSDVTVMRGTPRRTGRWIDDWNIEDPEFWESTGKQVAKRNLIWSIFAEHLGFSVWLLWSVSSALMAKAAFDFTPQQLFYLVAVPNLVGSALRLPYTFAVTKFGGRNWTVFSATLLLIPTLLFAYFIQRPDTPYWVFLAIAATAGFGGGNFSSSMTNINFFYPSRLKGSALGINAAGGNLGVAVIQFFLPIVVGVGGAFGLAKTAEAVHLERAGYIYAGLTLMSAVCAFAFMNNLSSAVSKPSETFAVAKYKHTWIMAFLYIGTFGSFIGYSAAMPLLIKINFFRSPIPTESIGINFAYYAFLGALIGSVARPFGGWLSDRIGGAKVTAACFVAMILGTLTVFFTLTLLKPVPVPDPAKLKLWQADPSTFPGFKPEVVDAVTYNAGIFPYFLLAFCFVFAATGVANGSTYKMIPHIWKAQAQAVTDEGTVERYAAEAKAVKEGSSVLGIVGAVGAFGGFLIPITFAAPWVTDPVSAVKNAFLIFTAFYAVCLAVTWLVYVRTSSTMGKAGV
jgi:NNP family nitrate/nitrite transporter-like MFS transporter